MAGNDDLTLCGLPSGGFDIEWRGEKVGRLVRRYPAGWVSQLTIAGRTEMPPPFARFEYGFPSLIDALDWMGNPPVKRVAARSANG